MRHLSAFVKAEPGSRRGAENFSSKNHFVVYDFVFWGFGQSYCRSSNNFECFLIFFFFSNYRSEHRTTSNPYSQVPLGIYLRSILN